MSQSAFTDRKIMSSSSSGQNYDKSNLKLDLQSKDSNNNNRKRKIFPLHSPAAGLLQSPDLKLLKLASPELEKIIINNNGFIPTGYTPTMTPGGVPSYIPTGEENTSSDDQDSFARGFIEALQKLQEQDVPLAPVSPPKVAESTSKGSTSRGEVTTAATTTTKLTTAVNNSARWPTIDPSTTRNSVPVITNRYDRPTPPPPLPVSHTPTPPPTVTNFPPQTPISSITSMGTTSTSTPHLSTSFINRPELPHKTSTQISSATPGITLPTPINTAAPSVPPPADTPIDTSLVKSEDDADDFYLDMNPISLEAQEHIKHQRKKLRNRLAAQRCRARKIEREDTLKAKVKELKQKNTELTSMSRDLRMQVCDLKQQVMQHVNQGCHVFLKDNEAEKTEN